MEQLLMNYDEENRKLDERLAQIDSETLAICEIIIKNPKQSVRIVTEAENTKKQIMKRMGTIG